MTLGQLLKNKRLELGKSVEQIATSTRIHVKVLTALEEDRYGELPARAFTRGFIIAYCKALHISPDEIMKDYHDFLESKFGERPEKDHGHQGYAFEGKELEQNKRGMIIIASVAAFFAILTLLFFKPQNHKRKEKHKELISEEAEVTASLATPTLAPDVIIPAPLPSVTPDSSIAQAPVTITTPVTTISTTATPTPSVTPTPSPTSSPTPSPSPVEDPLNKGDGMLPKDIGVKITFQAKEDVLVHYRSDDRKPYSIMLRKDKQLVIKANRQIKVQTNNPENLKYRLLFKNKAITGYLDLKEKHLDLRSDGTETTSSADTL